MSQMTHIESWRRWTVPTCSLPTRRRPQGVCRGCFAAQGFRRDAAETRAPAVPAPESVTAAPSGAAPRGAVLAAATQTSLGLAAAGVAARWGLHAAHDAGFDAVPDVVATLPILAVPLDESRLAHAGAAVLAAAVVTALRLALLQTWPDFRAETEAANSTVLPALAPADVAYVASASAVGEELLFRCALMPALGTDAVAVIVAGAVFGVLHISGGRKAAFAVWATAVGCLYGTLAVATHDGAAPMLAHALANVAGAALWKRQGEKT